MLIYSFMGLNCNVEEILSLIELFYLWFDILSEECGHWHWGWETWHLVTAWAQLPIKIISLEMQKLMHLLNRKCMVYKTCRKMAGERSSYKAITWAEDFVCILGDRDHFHHWHQYSQQVVSTMDPVLMMVESKMIESPPSLWSSAALKFLSIW